MNYLFLKIKMMDWNECPFEASAALKKCDNGVVYAHGLMTVEDKGSFRPKKTCRSRFLIHHDLVDLA